MPISDEIIRRVSGIRFGDYDMTLRFADGGRCVTAPYWWYPKAALKTRRLPNAATTRYPARDAAYTGRT